jgi:hypothetical protein
MLLKGKPGILDIHTVGLVAAFDLASKPDAYATPRRPNDELLRPLRARNMQVFVVGDCQSGADLLAATASGYAAGNQV